jgi:CheY-like chemotaxis protein
VQQILTFSRKSKLERKPLRLYIVMQETIKLLRASIPTTIEIRQNIAAEHATVLADPIQMHQVLVNLCANAAYAMRDGGGVLALGLDTVTIDASDLSHSSSLCPGQYVRLIVRDTGHGIAAAVKERIFEPFFTTKAEGEGTGMGLAVVHRIVASHEGVITVDSTPSQGTTITIYLPLFGELDPHPKHPNIEMPYLSSSHPSWQPATPLASSMANATDCILFVDDEESLVRLGDRTLSRLGYDVVTVTSSLEALTAFQSTPDAFDLVITDQTMPHMTGERLARELRVIRADIPIILCTGFSHDIDAEKAAAQGIDAFLLKPIHTQELALTVQNVLSRRHI